MKEQGVHHNSLASSLVLLLSFALTTTNGQNDDYNYNNGYDDNNNAYDNNGGYDNGYDVYANDNNNNINNVNGEQGSSSIATLEEWEWFNLVVDLAMIFVIIWGIYYVLYTDIATNQLMKAYRDEGFLVPGECVRCQASKQKKDRYDVLIMYTAVTTPRKRLRYPNESEPSGKRYLQKFQMLRPYSRGEMIDMIFMEFNPASGLTRELVEKNLKGFSQFKCTSLLLLGIAALGLVLWKAIESILENFENNTDDAILAWIVLVGGICLIALGAHLFSANEFDTQTLRRYNSARLADMALAIPDSNNSSSAININNNNDNNNNTNMTVVQGNSKSQPLLVPGRDVPTGVAATGGSVGGIMTAQGDVSVAGMTIGHPQNGGYYHNVNDNNIVSV